MLMALTRYLNFILIVYQYDYLTQLLYFYVGNLIYVKHYFRRISFKPRGSPLNKIIIILISIFFLLVDFYGLMHFFLNILSNELCVNPGSRLSYLEPSSFIVHLRKNWNFMEKKYSQ